MWKIFTFVWDQRDCGFRVSVLRGFGFLCSGFLDVSGFEASGFKGLGFLD